MNYKFQTITKKDLPKYKSAILEFFKKFRYPDDYARAIENSAFIAVCWCDDKIVGAGRVVSDLTRFSFIVDLNVKKDYQNQGIGKRLIKEMVSVSLKENIRYIELATDPNYPWLEEFYIKAGFEKVKGSTLMEWPRR